MLEQACVQFESEMVRDLLQTAVSGYVPQCDIVDPIWIQLASSDHLKQIAAIPSNVESISSNKTVN